MRGHTIEDLFTPAVVTNRAVICAIIHLPLLGLVDVNIHIARHYYNACVESVLCRDPSIWGVPIVIYRINHDIPNVRARNALLWLMETRYKPADLQCSRSHTGFYIAGLMAICSMSNDSVWFTLRSMCNRCGRRVDLYFPSAIRIPRNLANLPIRPVFYN
jgi:hypothetical protein